MAAVIVCSDFGAQENKLCQFPLSLYIFAMKSWDCIPWSYFFECWVLSPVFHSPLAPSSRGSVVLHFLTLDLYHLHIWSCWYFSWQSWFQLAIHPALHFAWCTLHRIQISRMKNITLMLSFPNFEPVIVPCLVLTVFSWTSYRFLKRQVRWSGIPISLRIFQFVVIHTVKGFSIVNEVKLDVFLEFLFFFYEPMDVGNLFSGPSAFSKSGFYLWKFSVHVLLKPCLKDFEDYLASM